MTNTGKQSPFTPMLIFGDVKLSRFWMEYLQIWNVYCLPSNLAPTKTNIAKSKSELKFQGVYTAESYTN